jgi:hypothetical protein
MQRTDLAPQLNPAYASVPDGQERAKEPESLQQSKIVPIKRDRNGSARKQAAPGWGRLAVISASAGAALGAVLAEIHDSPRIQSDSVRNTVGK